MKHTSTVFKKMATSLLLLMPLSAHASIIYSTNNSYYSYSSRSDTLYYTPSNNPAYWAARSDLTPLGFSDSGSGSNDQYIHNATTAFDINFSLDSVTDFMLTGSLYFNSDASCSGSTSVTLYSGSAVLFQDSARCSEVYNYSTGYFEFVADSVSLDFMTTLAAGDYRFVASVNPAAVGWGNYSIDVVTAVPLPASAWLLVSGLIMLVPASRRRLQAG